MGILNFIFKQQKIDKISPFEKRRRLQRDNCPRCGQQMIPIAVNKRICTYCGHVKFMF